MRCPLADKCENYDPYVLEVDKELDDNEVDCLRIRIIKAERFGLPFRLECFKSKKGRQFVCAICNGVHHDAEDKLKIVGDSGVAICFYCLRNLIDDLFNERAKTAIIQEF